MELPQTLEALHHHLGLLIGLLQQEQELLLHTPVPAEEDSLRRLRLEQDKQSHFRAIEGLENQCKDLRRTLGSAAPEELPLWKEVRDLTDQALRLHQLNSTLIRQGLVHEQCVLNNVRQLGSTSPTALAGLSQRRWLLQPKHLQPLPPVHHHASRAAARWRTIVACIEPP